MAASQCRADVGGNCGASHGPLLCAS
jgi:hypothetical protein